MFFFFGFFGFFASRPLRNVTPGISRILVRAISYTVHGLIPASCVFADRYNREEVVRSLGKEINLNPPLILGQLPDTPEELLKLDQVKTRETLAAVAAAPLSSTGMFRSICRCSSSPN